MYLAQPSFPRKREPGVVLAVLVAFSARNVVVLLAKTPGLAFAARLDWRPIAFRSRLRPWRERALLDRDQRITSDARCNRDRSVGLDDDQCPALA
jgi:hypothetical protein